MLKTVTLREPQIPMSAFMRANKRCALWAGMGTGKTVGVLYTLDLMKMLGEIDRNEPTLVVGPMRVARDTWPEEVARWDNFKDLTILPLTGTPERRRQKLLSKADIYTISYELAPWLVDTLNDKWRFKNVIADESDRLQGLRGKRGGAGSGKKAGRSGQRAFALARVAHTLVDRWVNLTGTPAPQGYHALWGQTWYLDRGARLGSSYGAFESRWTRPKWNGFGTEFSEAARKEIDERLKDICLTIDPHDYYDLREPLVRRVEVTLPPAARQQYKDLETKMFAEIQEYGELRVFNAGSLTSKCLQIASGAVYTQHPTWSGIHEAKIEALESIIGESGGAPIMVQYNFQHEAQRIQSRWKHAVDLSTREGLAAFKAGTASLGYAHPKSMGHGIDGLQHVCHHLVRFGHDWKTGERLQMLERIGPMRQFGAGYDRPVYVYDIVARDTLDEDVLALHETNCTVLEALMNAMKRRAQ